MNHPDTAATSDLKSTAIEGTRWPYLGALAFALLALPAFTLDISLARYLRDIQLPGDLRDLVRIAEVFAHGWGVLFILITVAVLAPQLRRRLPRIIACAAASGLTALLLKWTIARQRPHTCDLQGSVWSTFHGLSPWLSGESIPQLSGRQLESFPSGHTATAVGLAIGLSYLFPRGRWLFTFFALLAALQRMDSGAHFLSDTLVATAVAFLISGLCLDRRAVGRWFDRQEKQAPG